MKIMIKKQTLPAALAFAMACAFTTVSGADPSPGSERLINAMESTEGLSTGGWRFEKTAVEMSPATIPPKLGSGSVRFRGEASIAGAKGDFHLANQLPGNFQKLALWEIGRAHV